MFGLTRVRDAYGTAFSVRGFVPEISAGALCVKTRTATARGNVGTVCSTLYCMQEALLPRMGLNSNQV